MRPRIRKFAKNITIYSFYIIYYFNAILGLTRRAIDYKQLSKSPQFTAIRVEIVTYTTQYTLYIG